ncbi:TetR/AcrR family transcriptional regulator [Paractinoplanes durhamensis]|uniref:TetR family transcriptional regulator n=1 Tax=Paractinoplanes durhamensis TaxID=113563 RepID=A0ABQ3YNQ3_9ACTN|nr:TetR family transcriptional regulator [Actinoplanes durhamensis]GID99186.1 TetR family transcriptional regulator [Actinoplanes durhamensis]
MGLRDRKKQQTRSALTDAALRLADERGLDHVTVEEISAAADVSPRTFFNYFATKDDAILGDPVITAETVCERLLAVPREVPIIDAVLGVFTPAIEQIQADRELWLLRMRVIKNNPALLPILFARGAADEQLFVAAVAARGGLSAEDTFPQLAAVVTGAAFRVAMMRWSAAGPDHRLADFVCEAFGLLAAGLAHPVPTHQEVV